MDRLVQPERALAKARKSLASTKATVSERDKQLSTALGERKAEREKYESLRDRHKQLAAMFGEAKARVSGLAAANAALKNRLKAFTTNLEKTQSKLESLGVNFGQLEKSRAWGAVRVVLKTEAGLRRSYRRLKKAVGKEQSNDLTKAAGFDFKPN